MTQNAETPKWFVVVAIIALIWNMLGLMAFISHVMMTPEMISALPVAEQELYKNTPAWATASFAIAVIAGTLGCMLLLLKKPIAKTLLIGSVLGVAIQNYHAFFIIDSLSVYGQASMIMPLLVFVIALGLILLADKAEKNAWLT